MPIKKYLVSLLELKKKLIELEAIRKEDLVIKKIHKTEKNIILKDLEFFKTYVDDIDGIIYRINTMDPGDKKGDIGGNKFNNRKIKKKINMSLDDIIIEEKKDIALEMVDIGYNNYYHMRTVKNKDEVDNIEYNTLYFVMDLKQVVMKVGNPESGVYRIINTKLCKVYNSSKYNTDNSRSIICNNNIKEKGLKCNITNCNYYHDPFLGYLDNCHMDRQYSNNPIVYNSPQFKSGDQVKENVKKIKWHEAITLYQASLMNILIACAQAGNNSDK